MNNHIAITGILPPGSDVIERAQQGDADAFAVLYHAYKARIYSVCLRMTNNPSQAEDFTQEAFLLVFRKIASFRGDSAFSTWLHRIAINTVLMRFRKKSISQVPLDEPYCNSEGDNMRREYGTKDNRLEGCVNRVALANAIKDLPTGIGQSSSCTKSRATNIRKSQSCGVAPWGTRSHNCTKPSSECAGC